MLKKFDLILRFLNKEKMAGKRLKTLKSGCECFTSKKRKRPPWAVMSHLKYYKGRCVERETNVCVCVCRANKGYSWPNKFFR